MTFIHITDIEEVLKKTKLQGPSAVNQIMKVKSEFGTDLYLIAQYIHTRTNPAKLTWFLDTDGHMKYEELNPEKSS